MSGDDVNDQVFLIGVGFHSFLDAAYNLEDFLATGIVVKYVEVFVIYWSGIRDPVRLQGLPHGLTILLADRNTVFFGEVRHRLNVRSLLLAPNPALVEVALRKVDHKFLVRDENFLPLLFLTT